MGGDGGPSMLALAWFLTLLHPSAGASSPPAIAPVDARGAPAVHMLHLRKHESFTLQLFDAEGRLQFEALQALRTFLSDPRTHIDHPIHWRLATLLVAVAAHFPGQPLEVVSGYRHHNRHHDGSRHTRGHALDFRIKGVPNRTLFELLRASFADVGLGYYPNSTFVHLDVRDRSTFWVDYSGPGQTPCYSTTPTQDLTTGVAETLSYREAQALGCKSP